MTEETSFLRAIATEAPADVDYKGEETRAHYDLQKEVKEGLIDKDKVLNFDIDKYYHQISNKKSQKLAEDQARAEQLMSRATTMR